MRDRHYRLQALVLRLHKEICVRRLMTTIGGRIGAALLICRTMWGQTVSSIRRRFRRAPHDSLFVEQQLRRRYAFGVIDREMFEREQDCLKRGEQGSA